VRMSLAPKIAQRNPVACGAALCQQRVIRGHR
jgi:hypothetical protein